MSQLQAKARRANRNQRQRSLALQGTQIDNNAHINLNCHLANPSSNFSAETPTPNATGGQTNSAGEQLKTALQIAEPKTKYYATATQPQGTQDRIAAQAPVHLRLFSYIIDAETHSPEEREI
jgi:hypothetical protein